MRKKESIHVCVTGSPCCTVEKNYIGEITTEKKKNKNLPPNKSLGTHDFTGEFYQTYKEVIPLILKLFQRNKERVTPHIHSTRPPLL